MFPGIDFDVFCYIEDSPFLIGPLEDFCRKDVVSLNSQNPKR
jgi:hypothetical protein